jgi:hypothetical protein
MRKLTHISLAHEGFHKIESKTYSSFSFSKQEVGLVWWLVCLFFFFGGGVSFIGLFFLFIYFFFVFFFFLFVCFVLFFWGVGRVVLC